jgi:hypothetical protein
MTRIVLAVLAAPSLVPGALAQTTDEIIERALAGVPRQMSGLAGVPRQMSGLAGVPRQMSGLAAAPRQMSGLAAAPRQMKEECERIGTTNGLCVPRLLCGCQ